MNIHATLCAVLMFGACNGGKNTASTPVPEPASAPTPVSVSAPMAEATAPVVIYRTKQDHASHVPVTLSEDRTSIVAYPHPKDLRTAGELATPTDLGDGYLLDNRGIGLQVAFLSMDYAPYAALEQAPSLQELDAMIVERDPLESMYTCGPRSNYGDVAVEMSALVKSGSLLKRCKQLK